jgi:opacity protein-like surface antigen
MSISAGKLGFALLLAALCLSGRTAHAQAAPMSYWSPNWIGFGGMPGIDQDPNASGTFEGPGFSRTRFNFPNGMFVGNTSSSISSAFSGINQAGMFGSYGSLSYESTQFGYKFGGAGSMPVTLFGGLDTVKYNSGFSGSPFAAFDSKSGTVPGYRANAGIEFQPAPNVSLSLGFSYVQQQSGAVDSDINSVPGVSSIIPSGRR